MVDGALIRMRHWVAPCPDMHLRNDIATMATLDLSDKRESWCRGQYCHTCEKMRIPVMGRKYEKKFCAWRPRRGRIRRVDFICYWLG